MKNTINWKLKTYQKMLSFIEDVGGGFCFAYERNVTRVNYKISCEAEMLFNLPELKSYKPQKLYDGYWFNDEKAGETRIKILNEIISFLTKLNTENEFQKTISKR